MRALLDTQSPIEILYLEHLMAESLSLHDAVKPFVNDDVDAVYSVQPNKYELIALRDQAARTAAAHGQATGEA